MEKIDYKAIVNKAIGEKPSLVNPEWMKEADKNIEEMVDIEMSRYLSGLSLVKPEYKPIGKVTDTVMYDLLISNGNKGTLS